MEPQKIEPNLAGNSFKKTYKHHWVIGFIIVFSLVHIFLSFYVSIIKDSKSNCVSGAYCGEEHSDVYITLTDGTTDWKTYKNEEIGFEFKYPSDPENNGSYFKEMNIRVLENRQKIPLVDWIEENEEFHDTGSLSVKIYGNNNAIVANTSSDGGVGKTVYFENEDKIVAFDLFVFYKDKVPLEKYLSDFEQVLSTFKFTEMPITAADYSKPFQRGEYDYFGTATVEGYVDIVDKVCDPKMDGDIPCGVYTAYKYAVFHVIDSDNDVMIRYLEGDEYNSFVGESFIGLGCYEQDKKIIKSINAGEGGAVNNQITGLDLDTLLSSGPANKVKLQVTKSYVQYGKGVPLCYSAFRNFKVLK